VRALVAAWLALCVFGFGALALHDSRPARTGDAASHWPDGVRLGRDPRVPTLVLAAHPRCACTPATVDSLSWAVARSARRARVYVLLVRPRGKPEGWERTPLWDAAASVPGALVVSDPDGAQARLFGASTSGETMLYDENGRLMFRGGITGARGHFGDNPGREALLARLEGRSWRPATAPVFGCALGTTEEAAWNPAREPTPVARR
jgi:hypothetical protein